MLTNNEASFIAMTNDDSFCPNNRQTFLPQQINEAFSPSNDAFYPNVLDFSTDERFCPDKRYAPTNHTRCLNKQVFFTNKQQFLLPRMKQFYAGLSIENKGIVPS